jgi:hypothetical protein
VVEVTVGFCRRRIPLLQINYNLSSLQSVCLYYKSKVQPTVYKGIVLFMSESMMMKDE